MAWYTVKCSCGHEIRIQLYGKENIKQWKIDQMKDEFCSECKKEKYNKEMQIKGLVLKRIKYRDYKKFFYDNPIVKNSYNFNDKTIEVYIPFDTDMDKEELKYQEKILIYNTKYNLPKLENGEDFRFNMILAMEKIKEKYKDVE